MSGRVVALHVAPGARSVATAGREWVARAPLSAVGAGLAVEFLAVLAIAVAAAGVDLPVFYVPHAPARGGAVLSGAVAGYLAARDGPARSGRSPRWRIPTWVRRGGGVGLAVGLVAVAVGGAGAALRTVLWPLLVVPALVVAARDLVRRRGTARIVPGVAAVVLVALASGRVRTGVGLLTTAAALLPRVGAYAFLGPTRYGAILLAVSVGANAVGGVVGWKLARGT